MKYIIIRLRQQKIPTIMFTVNAKVGQNIATILGTTTGLNVKSFVDMWFMPILTYKGNVAYYNESENHSMSYFTQLIWGESDSVGCGRARFYLQSKQKMAVRLVCNFAPKGNFRGKPIYTIGYPATQCRGNSAPNTKYIGLCTKQFLIPARKFTSRPFPPSSLLRILNLSNNSTKDEMDSNRNNLKQSLFEENDTKDHRYQKSRHIYFDRTSDSHRRPSHYGFQKHSAVTNIHKSRKHLNKETSRMLKVYYNQRYDALQDKKEKNLDLRKRYDSKRTYKNSASETKIDQCTRKITPTTTITTTPNNISKKYRANACTRKSNINCKSTTPFQTTSHGRCSTLNVTSIFTELCPCNKKTTTCITIPTICNCYTNCKCLENKSPKWESIKDFRKFKMDKKENPNINYQEMFPNIEVKNGAPIIPINHYPILYPWIVNTMKPTTNIWTAAKTTPSNSYLYSNEKYTGETLETRKKRQHGLNSQITLKPFWQMDELHYKMPTELRSLRYTTIPSRRSKLTTRTSKMQTESITIRPKQPKIKNQKDHVSERYLSFEELMHLRKLNPGDNKQDWRRKESQGNILREDTTTLSTDPTTAETSEITTNTPFIRNKYCTRKLTCTWTAFTGNETSNIGGIIDHGSRTPPGYVDGCTRTSTCTREFMDRNKMDSVSHEDAGATTIEDQDYCEKRSLNVRRRNLEVVTTADYYSNAYRETYTHSPLDSNKSYRILSTEKIIESLSPGEDCSC
ncbi:uncharacterized protein LOC101744381 isoform X1 [Bombyx mori]|uniref:uncharacterized protein LOC101744381 isoform X1 n=1 Tax=Bombyx mori TaxID=7091 RepID=UPI000B3C451D